MLGIPKIYTEVKSYIQRLTRRKGGIQLKELENKVVGNLPETKKRLLLRALETQEIYTVRDGYVLLRKESLSSIIQNLTTQASKDKAKKILLLRLHGETLQAIGDRYHLTRERIRQIAKEEVQKLPLLVEDYYAKPFTFFRFGKYEFLSTFRGCIPEVYEYLCLRYKKGQVPYDEFEYEDYHGIFSKTIQVHFENIKKPVSELICTMLSEQVNAITVEEVEVLFSEYCNKNCPEKGNIQINSRKIAELLEEKANIVVNQDGKYRYSAVNGDNLCELIDWDRYQNRTISIKTIYADHQSIFGKMDIRDGYELYTLLKKSQIRKPWLKSKFPVRFLKTLRVIKE